MANRRTVTYDAFSIEIPEHATTRTIDDGATLVISLPTDPVTEVLLGHFPFRDDLHLDPGARLKGILECFVDEIIPKRAGPVVSRELRYWSQGLLQAWCGRLLLANGRAWTASFVAKHGAEGYFLVHWNGNPDDEPLAQQMIHSLLDDCRFQDSLGAGLDNR